MDRIIKTTLIKNVRKQYHKNISHPACVAAPDPGSGAFLTQNPGSGFFRFPALGSQTYILELNDNFLVKKIYNSL
jgi:hypothetical protein